uniref:Uncharacterized protein n=1 Tax=Anguilla anguilla TaxID=7936 RepID=A0A0E9XYT8_ANGAN
MCVRVLYVCVFVCVCVWDPLAVALLQLLSVHYAVFTEIY